jgi:hypothetical protein
MGTIEYRDQSTIKQRAHAHAAVGCAGPIQSFELNVAAIVVTIDALHDEAPGSFDRISERQLCCVIECVRGGALREIVE